MDLAVRACAKKGAVIECKCEMNSRSSHVKLSVVFNILIFPISGMVGWLANILTGVENTNQLVNNVEGQPESMTCVLFCHLYHPPNHPPSTEGTNTVQQTSQAQGPDQAAIQVSQVSKFF